MRATSEDQPGLTPLAGEEAAFDREAAQVPPASRAMLASAQAAPISRAGFLGQIDSCVRHLAAWLGGDGAARQPTDSDVLAAAEQSRVQLWRWLHCGDAVLDDGTPIDFPLFDAAIQRVGERLPRRGLPGQGNVLRAACLLAELTHAHTLAESVTVAAPVRGC